MRFMRVLVDDPMHMIFIIGFIVKAFVLKHRNGLCESRKGGRKVY